MLAQLASIKKAVASLIGTVLLVLVFANDHLGDFIPGSWRGGLIAVIAVLTPVATWLVRNKPVEAA
jgi:hypothetical protein